MPNETQPELVSLVVCFNGTNKSDTSRRLSNIGYSTKSLLIMEFNGVLYKVLDSFLWSESRHLIHCDIEGTGDKRELENCGVQFQKKLMRSLR